MHSSSRSLFRITSLISMMNWISLWSIDSSASITFAIVMISFCSPTRLISLKNGMERLANFYMIGLNWRWIRPKQNCHRFHPVSISWATSREDDIHWYDAGSSIISRNGSDISMGGYLSGIVIKSRSDGIFLRMRSNCSDPPSSHIWGIWSGPTLLPWSGSYSWNIRFWELVSFWMDMKSFPGISLQSAVQDSAGKKSGRGCVEKADITFACRSPLEGSGV